MSKEDYKFNESFSVKVHTDSDDAFVGFYARAEEYSNEETEISRDRVRSTSQLFSFLNLQQLFFLTQMLEC